MRSYKIPLKSLLLLSVLLFTGINVQAQSITVQGTVKDADTGTTLPGVNIKVKGVTAGTSTNKQGRYSLQVPGKQDTLIFSYIGYKTKNVPIKGRSSIDIVLKPEVISGQQMVVVGYGAQKEENLTGAVSQIHSDDIEVQSVNNTTKSLRGLTPNLNIGVTSQAGEADANASLNIRGIGSLSGSSPYIVIDGMRATQSELSALNPNDIKNVSVLKDAAASAIYGSSAAFGAIVVTTKGGEKNEALSVNYSANVRLKRRIFVPSSINSLQFAKRANLAAENVGAGHYFTEEQLTRIRDYMNGDIEHQTMQKPNNANQWLGIGSGRASEWYTGYANNNWNEIMYKNLEVTQKHDISVKGGSDNMTYYLSGGFLNDPGQLRYGGENEYYKRYNLTGNFSADITDWLEIRDITRFSSKKGSFPASLDKNTRARYYHDINRIIPMAPYKTPAVKDDQGNVIVPEQLAQQAGWLENNGFNRYMRNTFATTLKANADIFKNFVIKGDFSFKRRFYNKTLNYKKWTLLAPNGEPSLTFQKNNNQINKNYRKTRYTSFNIYGNYTNTFFDDHNVSAMLGYQQENYSHNALAVSRKNVINNNLNSLNVATGDVLGPNNPLTDYATLGTFGRLQYNYKQKYLIEFNGRYDGSSRFAPGHRFVFSPSVSAGYNIDKEKFWDPVQKYINKFKIRASYGSLGNQDVSNYLYVSNLPIHNRLNWILGEDRPVYTSMQSINSPNITWETVTTKDIGVDLSFLDNRLKASGDIYERNTDNMFGPVAALPSVLGTSPPKTNSASLRTRGWEASLEWQDQLKNDLSYHIKLMASNSLSRITKYYNPKKVLNSHYVGQTVGEIWGYKADGLFQTEEEVDNYLSKVDLNQLGGGWQTGDIKYRDLNSDGKVNNGSNTVDDPGDRRIIGNRRPQYQYSIIAGAVWKRLSIKMLWQGVGKRNIVPNHYSSIFWGWSSRGHTHITKTSYKSHWSEDNPDGYLPKVEDSGRNGNNKNTSHKTDRYMQNAAYIRLKSLELSYTLPSSLTDRINLKNLTVFANGQNLLTFTSMWPEIDPEIARPSGFRHSNNAGIGYPLAQTFALGVNISL